jgi:hypothetical protein
MSAFEIFVDDDRYSVPTLLLITSEDEALARREAVALLLASRHHLGVELCRGDDRLLALGTFAQGARTEMATARQRRVAE